MSLSPSTCLYTFIIYPQGRTPDRWIGWLSSVVSLVKVLSYASGCPRSTSALRNMCCSVFSVYTFVLGISLSCFLTLSLSLPPPPSSWCLSLYLNILFSMCMCLSVVWECVFDSEKKRASAQVQGNSWYQRVESLSLSLSLSHFLSLSCLLSLKSESSIEHCVVSKRICNLVCFCHLISKSDEKCHLISKSDEWAFIPTIMRP